MHLYFATYETVRMRSIARANAHCAVFARSTRARAETSRRARTTTARASARRAADACRASALAFVLAHAAIVPDAIAGLNKSGNSDAYAEMMKQMELERARDASAAPAMSAEGLFKAGGGACGEGYELKVVKVLGASCECVSESCAGDKSRKERTEMERSFGKAGDEETAGAAPAGGIKFTFASD